MNDSQPARATVPLAVSACLVAIVGVAAMWAAISVFVRGMAPWMALLAAADAALLLRLAHWPRGNARAAIGAMVTLLTIGVAQYFVATARIGVEMGLRPHEALPLMSPGLASLFAVENVGPLDWACYVAALLLAWFASR